MNLITCYTLIDDPAPFYEAVLDYMEQYQSIADIQFKHLHQDYMKLAREYYPMYLMGTYPKRLDTIIPYGKVLMDSRLSKLYEESLGGL